MRGRPKSSSGFVTLLSTFVLVAALPEIIQRVQPAGQPRIDGYQLEMAAYHLKAGMGDAEPEFFPLYERCSQYTMTSWDRLYNLHMAVRYIMQANIPGELRRWPEGLWRMSGRST